MIEKFANASGEVSSELLDLNHTRESRILVLPMIPKFAPGRSPKLSRTSESGH